MTKATFEAVLDQILSNGLLSGLLSDLRDKQAEHPLKMAIRPLLIQHKPMYQVSLHTKQKVTHHNMTAAECVKLVSEQLENVYKQGMFATKDFDYHVLVNKHRQMTVLQKKSHSPKDLPMHNRQKNYILEEGTPVSFLIDLGIMTPAGKVIAKKYDKYRQINRFLEMVRDVVNHLPKDRRLEIVDFGCGKAYLTFALYHYLTQVEKRAINLLGLDLKQDVIEHCQQLAEKLGYEHLRFAVGDINQHVASGKIDMVISLHACDTATDAALEKAVQWQAEVILCVPCCQHELYGQVQNEALNSLLKYGILKERFAALATDAARAELLIMLGYDVQILEFIDLEHTPKNLLIRAVRNPSSVKQKHAEMRYLQFSRTLNIQPSLWQRMFAKSH